MCLSPLRCPYQEEHSLEAQGLLSKQKRTQQSVIIRGLGGLAGIYFPAYAETYPDPFPKKAHSMPYSTNSTNGLAKGYLTESDLPTAGALSRQDILLGH